MFPHWDGARCGAVSLDEMRTAFPSFYCTVTLLLIGAILTYTLSMYIVQTMRILSAPNLPTPCVPGAGSASLYPNATLLACKVQVYSTIYCFFLPQTLLIQCSRPKYRATLSVFINPRPHADRTDPVTSATAFIFPSSRMSTTSIKSEAALPRNWLRVFSTH